MSKKKDKAGRVETALPEAEAAFDDRGLLLVSKALSDPRRLEVLRRIAGADSASCTDLRECLQMNPATLSHHLRQLESAGLIETRRDGKFVHASLRRKTWKTYMGHLKTFVA